MKYIRQEYVLATLRDEELKKLDEIESLVNDCIKNRINISIDIKINNSCIIHRERARITRYEKEKVDVLIVDPKQKFNMKNINLSDIIKIHVIDFPIDDALLRPDISRYDLMDLS